MSKLRVHTVQRHLNYVQVPINKYDAGIHDIHPMPTALFFSEKLSNFTTHTGLQERDLVFFSLLFKLFFTYIPFLMKKRHI